MPTFTLTKHTLLAVAIGLMSVNTFSQTPVPPLPSAAELAKKPWMNKSLPSAHRAQLVLAEMTQEEKLRLVLGKFGNHSESQKYTRPPEAYPQSAGIVFGIPRLGIPHLWETDAGIGVASQEGPEFRPATALPAGISTAATWNPSLARQGGAMIGAEARAYGFNVMLAGGVNLVREPRNGRNFEYAGEDPYLAGVMVGEQIKGIQSNHIVSTLKHFALNNQETGRNFANVIISDDAARHSDLLALQIANDIGAPGSVMCAYNRVNGYYSCENDYLLNQVLKGDWGFKGWVMSDWGATHSTIPAANNGLDQQSGESFDKAQYFGPALKEAVDNGWVSAERLNTMAQRILYSLFQQGVIDHPVAAQPSSINFKKHAQVSLSDSVEGMVLLKNAERLLPLGKHLKKIAVIGGRADIGVLAGGGSSLVYPQGGNLTPKLEPIHWPGPVMHYPSSPLKALQAKMPNTQFVFVDGTQPQAAASAAADSDIALVFANQWTCESLDVGHLSLPDQQDALISAVAAANPKTAVILQTGGPVTMPWLPKVGAVLEAWYPGTEGGEAIAQILTGEANPSGRLPVTFPVSEAQLPRPQLDGYPEKWVRFDINYNIEGAAVGYKWFQLKQLTPLFPFGYGLSYSTFSLQQLKAEYTEKGINVSFSATNTGDRAGQTVAQVYAAPPSPLWEAPQRLVGFYKFQLKPNQTKSTHISLDPRLLARYQSASKTWLIQAGQYQLYLATDANSPVQTIQLQLPQLQFNQQGLPIQ